LRRKTKLARDDNVKKEGVPFAKALRVNHFMTHANHGAMGEACSEGDLPSAVSAEAEAGAAVIVGKSFAVEGAGALPASRMTAASLLNNLI
jgi:hypothetical protein